MTRDDHIGRRAFLGLAGSAGASLVVLTLADGRLSQLDAALAAPEPFAPNQWLRIAPDGRVTVTTDKSEMGQGVRTALPIIAAAELGADWRRVRVEHARPSKTFSDMGTAGSGSMGGRWLALRQAAAAAREMLIGAAAARWNVDPSTCTTRQHEVIHEPTRRRLAFASLVEAARRRPVPAQPALRPDDSLTLLKERVPRVDAHAIVAGRATYGIDVRVRGMRFAALARPPVRGATLGAWNADKARAFPGVQRVIAIPSGIAVVATNTWAAFRGRDLLEVTWNRPDAPADGATYIERLEARLDAGKVARRENDAAAAIAGAERRMEATFYSGFQAHASIEPPNCVAHVKQGSCEIWTGTQSPNGAQARAAELLGIPPERVTVNVTLIGGGFGRRLHTDYVLEAVELSRAIAAPVQVVWSREDDLRHDSYQSAQVNRLTAGISGGKIIGWRHRVSDYHLTMFGPYDPNYDPPAGGDPWGGFDTPYAFPALDVTLAVSEAPVATGAWRAVTYPAAVFARESFIDEIAHSLGRDPVELRLEIIPSPGIRRGRTIDLANGDRLRAVLRAAAERAQWGTPIASNDGRRWGRGVACNPYHQATMVAQVADVSVGTTGDIRVHRVVTAIDCGRVVDRAGLEAQVEGGVGWALSSLLKGEITFANGVARQGNFNDYPVLRLREMPAQEIVIIEGAPRPFGAGEPTVPAVWPAVSNAVFAATGQRLRRTPLRVQG